MQKRLIYKRLVLKEFYYAGALSCAELSVRIGKSIPFTTQLLNDLVAEDLVTEEGLAPSNGGRRPALYSVKPDAMYIVAVAMDQMVTRVAIMDINNKPVAAPYQYELQLDHNTDALYHLKEAIEESIKRPGSPGKRYWA